MLTTLLLRFHLGPRVEFLFRWVYVLAWCLSKPCGAISRLIHAITKKKKAKPVPLIGSSVRTSMSGGHTNGRNRGSPRSRLHSPSRVAAGDVPEIPKRRGCVGSGWRLGVRFFRCPSGIARRGEPLIQPTGRPDVCRSKHRRRVAETGPDVETALAAGRVLPVHLMPQTVALLATVGIVAQSSA